MWAAVALSYYGLSFNSVKLSDSPHLDFMLSASTEVFATFACARAMDSPRLGRRASLAAMMSTITVSLVFSNPNPSPNPSPNPDPDPNPNPDPNPYPNQVSLVFSLAFTPLARWLSLVGKFAATGAFNLIYIQTAELFPTVVRTLTLRLTRTLALTLVLTLTLTLTLALTLALTLTLTRCAPPRSDSARPRRVWARSSPPRWDDTPGRARACSSSG